MVDTIRISGQLEHIKLNPTFTQLVTIVNSKDKEKIPTFCMEKNEEGKYQAFYHHATNRLTIQMNIGKLIFGHNCYNYNENSVILNRLIRLFGGYFFPSGHFYISRCDIGGTVTYENFEELTHVLERFRSAKLGRAHVAKYRNQVYKTAVRYQSKDWVFTIYNKGKEMRHNKVYDLYREGLNFEPDNTLRFEKQYGSNEMARLGMQKQPYYGVFIDSFDVKFLLDDFFDVLKKWEFTATPHLSKKRGLMGALDVINNLGRLDDVKVAGVVSDSSYYRYKRENFKSNYSDFIPSVNFDQNKPADLKMIDKVFIFGPNSFLS